MKIRGALYISAYEYNYKINNKCNTILQEYYNTYRRKWENTKRYTFVNCKKEAHESQRKNSRAEQGAWKDGTPDGRPMIHASAAHLWSAAERIHKLQVSGSEHANLGESETPQRVAWWMPWHARTSTRSINPNQKHALKTVSWPYKPEHERSIKWWDDRSNKTGCTSSVDRFMRLIPRGDNPNKKTLIHIPYTSCLHRLSTHNLSCL